MKTLDVAGLAGPIVTVKILDSTSTVGAGKTGLTNASSGLIIAVRPDNSATTTVYTSAGSTIDTIATLGTWAAPTTGHCRFLQVDSTNHPGHYELQFVASLWATSGARKLTGTIQATGGVQTDFEIQLTGPDLSLAAGSAKALIQFGTGAGQINPDGTGALPIAFGTTVPATPTTGTTGAAMAWASGKVGRVGTAQGGTASTITLDAGASAVDNAYKDHSLKLTGGTGSGQYATILSYVGSTKVATVYRPSGNWSTTPDATTTFLIELVPAVDLLATQSFNNTGQTAKYAATLAAADVTGNLPANVTQWLAGTPNALVSGRVDASAGAVADKSGYSLTQTFPAGFSALTTAAIASAVQTDVSDTLGADIAGINTAAATLLTRIPGTVQPQTGDAFARIGANGAGLTAVTLGAAGLDAIVVETGLNARQAMSINAASLGGVLSGAGTGTITIKGAGVGTTRIVAQVDSSGNRSSLTLTPPA